MEPRPARARRDRSIRMLLDRLEAADAAGGAILDGFPRNRAQAEALDSALADAGARVDAALLHRGADRGAGRGAWPAAGSARPPATSTTCTSNPPEVAGRLRHRRLAARSSAPTTTERDRPGAARRSSSQPAATSSPTTGRQGVLRTVDGRGRHRRGHRRDCSRPLDRRRRGTPDDGHPQVARRDRARCAGPAGSWPRCWSSSRRSSSRASRPPSSTASPRRTSAAPAASPSFKGYPGLNPRRPFPASVCISIDDEIVHGIPGERTHPRRPDRLGRRRRDRRGLARRRRADVLRRRRRRDEVAELIETTRGRDARRHRRGRARQPHRGHLRRRRGRRAAEGLRHRPPVRRPRDRHRDARGAAGPELPHRTAGPQARARACASPSSRCSRSAGHEARVPPTTGPS